MPDEPFFFRPFYFQVHKLIQGLQGGFHLAEIYQQRNRLGHGGNAAGSQDFDRDQPAHGQLPGLDQVNPQDDDSHALEVAVWNSLISSAARAANSYALLLCAHCGAVFFAWRKGVLYHSNSCKVMAARSRQEERS